MDSAAVGAVCMPAPHALGTFGRGRVAACIICVVLTAAAAALAQADPLGPAAACIDAVACIVMV
jgi:hypothetical protein